MGGLKDSNGTRPEDVKALYEQVVNLDCLLTSIETQIEVLTTVKEGLPKDFPDTFHDSGTSGHEPDSLEAIETLVSSEGESKSPSHVHPENGGGPGGGKPGETAVLLHLERSAHRQTQKALQDAQQRLGNINKNQRSSALNLSEADPDADLNSLESLNSVTSTDPLAEELRLKEMTIRQLRMRVLRLEKARLGKIPVDTVREITRATASMMEMEKARDEVTLQNFTLKSKLAELTNRINDPAATYQVNKDLSLKSDLDDDTRSIRMSTYKVNADNQRIRHLYTEFSAKEEAYQKKISQLEEQILNQANSSADDRTMRRMESELEASHRKAEATERFLLNKEEEYNVLKLDLETLNEENIRLKNQLNEAISSQEEKQKIMSQFKELETKNKLLEEENRLLGEDFNRERILRKRFYNQVEEMKGKIRVFCRLRPVSDIEKAKGGEVVAYPEDEYSILLDTHKGRRSFVFDRVFHKGEDQSKIFEDTNALIQSALDGFNVTIMAYGQTGSGKTYTMLGNNDKPGIAPRAFQRIFELIEESQGRQEVSVSAYMLELYNDKLIDLLKTNSYMESEKLEVKKDKKGAVFVSGAGIRSVSSASALNAVFEEGLANRHTAETKLNLSSSRSHLVIAVLLTITSKQTGSTSRGKLTLVDLAGSERTQKSGVTNDQLKEANSINKSLSALGDVIAALSSDSSFVPYRNSKLTMLLQDSIGGNAKTLVFVNVSPATFNSDETLVSLMYASRIKQITNGASKNFDTKEVSRLKAIIAKLKRGENVDEDS